MHYRLHVPSDSASDNLVDHHGIVTDDGEAEVIVGEVVVVRAHELHELAVHAQDDNHLQLLVVEQCVALYRL